MDQRDFYCPYSLSSEITAKPTVLGLYLCVTHTCHMKIYTHIQQRGKKTLLSLTLICYCHLVGMVKIVRGSALLSVYNHETPLLDDLADLLCKHHTHIKKIVHDASRRVCARIWYALWALRT